MRVTPTIIRVLPLLPRYPLLLVLSKKNAYLVSMSCMCLCAVTIMLKYLPYANRELRNGADQDLQWTLRLHSRVNGWTEETGPAGARRRGTQGGVVESRRTHSSTETPGGTLVYTENFDTKTITSCLQLI